MYTTKYDRQTKDIAVFYNGEYIGSRSTPQEAEALKYADMAQRRGQ